MSEKCLCVLRRHTLSRRRIIPLPQWKANPETDPEALFSKDQLVLALYPQTTCFYRALIHTPPHRVRLTDVTDLWSVIVPVSNVWVSSDCLRLTSACVCSRRTTTRCCSRTRRTLTVTPRRSTWLRDTWSPAKRTRRSERRLKGQTWRVDFCMKTCSEIFVRSVVFCRFDHGRW